GKGKVLSMLIDRAMPPALVRQSAAATDPWARRARWELVGSLGEHSLLIALIAVYVGYGRLLPRWFGVATAGADDLYSGLFFVLTGAAAGVVFLCYAIHLKLVVKPANFVGT